MTDKELHYGFMCAALSKLLTSNRKAKKEVVVAAARLLADAALEEYKKRWEIEVTGKYDYTVLPDVVSTSI